MFPFGTHPRVPVRCPGPALREWGALYRYFACGATCEAGAFSGHAGAAASDRGSSARCPLPAAGPRGWRRRAGRVRPARRGWRCATPGPSPRGRRRSAGPGPRRPAADASGRTTGRCSGRSALPGREAGISRAGRCAGRRHPRRRRGMRPPGTARRPGCRPAPSRPSGTKAATPAGRGLRCHGTVP